MTSIPKEEDFNGYEDWAKEKLYKEALEDWAKEAKEENKFLLSNIGICRRYLPADVKLKIESLKNK